MTSSSDGVRCTLHDGSVWLHLDDGRVSIPSHLLHKSKTLMDVVASGSDTSVARGFTLAAPKEWLQAWLSCYGSEEDHLGCEENTFLANCLMVCFCSRNAAASMLTTIFTVSACCHCVHSPLGCFAKH
jgi:hypothetical protein